MMCMGNKTNLTNGLGHHFAATALLHRVFKYHSNHWENQVPVSTRYKHTYQLVGGWFTPLKNMNVNWDDDIPNINGKIKNGNQTTNQTLTNKLWPELY